MVRSTVRFGAVVLVALATLVAAGCSGGSDDQVGDGDVTVERLGAAVQPTLVIVNALTFDVSVVPGIGTSAQSLGVQPGGSVRAVSDFGPCVGAARNGAVVRIALQVSGGRMEVGTPAKCTDPGLGDAVAVWNADEPSGTRQLESLIPETQLCLNRLGPLEAQVRIEPAGSVC